MEHLYALLTGGCILALVIAVAVFICWLCDNASDWLVDVFVPILIFLFFSYLIGTAVRLP